MEAQTVRSTQEIVQDLRKVSTKNTAVYTRRTTMSPYVSEYRKNAICTVPYGEEHYEFSFSVRKALALQEMMKDGSFDRMVEVAVRKQNEIDKRENRKMVDVIQL